MDTDASMRADCLFCAIVAGETPSAMVAETETTFAFMDIHPGSDGHLLVVPKRHSTDLRDIPEQDLADVAIESQRIANHVFDAWGADGVNLLNCCGKDAWQTVFHFHMHVIPRYRDKVKDRLRLPFEPGVRGDGQLNDQLATSMRSALDVG
ncbi:HIT family protein [Brevibacterium marinum]|uniref:Histidine triad (HIT) family protein n=1 Tax=Brevibacterium marinum TaxID=418643 RepID=A0A846S1H6_9MICO|nr:HIT domain-containing protein [Brevibacterium marinum]NJC56833.1 histidine triad (HIT) family protein [Brevibacterium marinum]